MHRNLSAECRGIFFTTKNTKKKKKKSWDEQRIPPVKTVSHKIFSGRFVLFVVKKNPLLPNLTDALPMHHFFKVRCLRSHAPPNRRRPDTLPGTLLSRARRVWSAPWLGGDWSFLNHDEKIVLQKRIYKKNHRQSCRNIGIPENHQVSQSP